MLDTYRRALEGLNFPFATTPPEVITAQEAAALEGVYRLYSVSWWGNDEQPLPAGFTHCRVGEYLRSENAYELFLYEDREYNRWKRYRKLCPPDWILLVFRGEIEGANPAQDDLAGRLKVIE